MVRPANKPATIEDLYAIPDDEWHYELSRGTLIAEPPRSWTRVMNMRLSVWEPMPSKQHLRRERAENCRRQPPTARLTARTEGSLSCRRSKVQKPWRVG